MPFKFSLQAVLHFRQSVEHQQELRLRTANQHVARTRHLIEQIETRMREGQVRQAQALGSGTSAAELRFALLCATTLEQQHRELERELVRLQSLRDEQQKIFQQARRQRETLEGLRDGQLRKYERQASREEQRRLDEMFLMRRAQSRRG
jgi:flagellar export protein FliJ